jgi:hypothetical protein
MGTLAIGVVKAIDALLLRAGCHLQATQWQSLATQYLAHFAK